MKDHLSTEEEIIITRVMDELKNIEAERLDDCGRVASSFDCEEQDEMDSFMIAGRDLEHVEEYRKAVRSYCEEERWLQ
jgi:hypothetical protein